MAVATTGEVIMVMAIMVAPAMVTMAADMVMAIDLGMATGRAMAIGRYMAAAIAELRDAAMVVAACTAVVATDKQRSLAGARG